MPFYHSERRQVKAETESMPSQSRVAQARRYIEHQSDHHRTRTFQDELRLFLRRYGIEYDDRYVWD